MELKFIYELNEMYHLDENNKKIVRATFPFIKDNVVDINHTFVTPELRGRGIAGMLMNSFYDYVKEKGYKVVATCPYAVTWFERHKERQDVLLDIEKNIPECLI